MWHLAKEVIFLFPLHSSGSLGNFVLRNSLDGSSEGPVVKKQFEINPPSSLNPLSPGVKLQILL